MLQSSPPHLEKTSSYWFILRNADKKNSTSIEVLPLYRMSWKNYFFFAYL